MNIARLTAYALLAGPFVAAGAKAEPAAVALTIKDHKFEPAEIRIKADQPLTLTVRNLDATAEEFESKPLRIEKVIPANGEAHFSIRALKAGRYKFIGEFHEDSAKGEIVVD
ncbi:MAG: cupredoxin domain-containing protein [Methylocystis sp.]|nr:cupredoxin domain-containing protein [Methylocystis sp.]